MVTCFWIKAEMDIKSADWICWLFPSILSLSWITGVRGIHSQLLVRWDPFGFHKSGSWADASKAKTLSASFAPLYLYLKCAIVMSSSDCSLLNTLTPPTLEHQAYWFAPSLSHPSIALPLTYLIGYVSKDPVRRTHWRCAFLLSADPAEKVHQDLIEWLLARQGQSHQRVCSFLQLGLASCSPSSEKSKVDSARYCWFIGQSLLHWTCVTGSDISIPPLRRQSEQSDYSANRR